MTGIDLQYSCAHYKVSVQSRYAISCTDMYLYSTCTSTARGSGVMRCDVCAAIAQIEILEYSSGVRYEGQVNQDGQDHGKGVWSHSDGDRYVGEFRNYEYHGHGTMTYADGRVESGKFENGWFKG